jgi:hypothetical protein
VTPEEFVEVIRVVAVEQAAEGEMRVLRQPPSQRPWPNLGQRSEWFLGLEVADQRMVAKVALGAAFASAVSFCDVLDGTTAF